MTRSASDWKKTDPFSQLVNQSIDQLTTSTPFEFLSESELNYFRRSYLNFVIPEKHIGFKIVDSLINNVRHFPT